MTGQKRGGWRITRSITWWVAVLWLVPSFADARRAVPAADPSPAPAPPPQPAAGVSFGAVDASTVRIFAVQNVTSEQMRAQRGQRVVAIPNMGHGTGFAVPGGDSLVLTAAHVVQDATYVVVRLPGEGAYFPARVAYRDDARDVAVLLIDGVIPPIELQPATHTLRTRQPVFAVGYPLDASRRQAQSSRGIVGGLMDDGRVQLDMAVNPGNSGGPIIDESDRVVGMVVARGDVERGVQGLAVAVALATLHDAVGQARERIRDGRIPALPSDAQRAAHVIDTLSRVGLMRVLREASDVTEGTANVQAIAEVRALDVPELSPDMQVFVAAFLWDAAQMLMYRAGNVIHPNFMPRSATRTLTEELLNQATRLLRSAVQRDPTVADRSPFVNRVPHGSPIRVTSAGPRRRAPVIDPEIQRTQAAVAAPPQPTRNHQTFVFAGGLGVGAAGFVGRTEARSGSSPTMPGGALRWFITLQISPVPVFVLAVDVDFLMALGAQVGDGTTPSRADVRDSTPNTVGGGIAAILRFHPQSRPFFFSGLLRVGGQTFEDVDRRKRGYLLVQPGLEVGYQLAAVDLAMRAAIGVPRNDQRASMYTVTLNVGFRLSVGRSGAAGRTTR